MTDSKDAGSGPEHREPANHSGGLVSWLFNPKQRRFMLPATGAWILALDWLLFSSNVLTAWLATPVAMVVGFVLGGAGAYLLQKRRAKDRPWRAALKVLLSSGLGDARKEMMNK